MSAAGPGLAPRPAALLGYGTRSIAPLHAEFSHEERPFLGHERREFDGQRLGDGATVDHHGLEPSEYGVPQAA